MSVTARRIWPAGAEEGGGLPKASGAREALWLCIHLSASAEEKEGIERLADWAQKFTPVVSVERDARGLAESLLLEISGSLTLFGGFERLWQAVAQDLAAQGFRAQLSAAPTPLAALFLARAGREVGIVGRAHLTGALSNLPLDVLRLEDQAMAWLASIGARRLGDCLRLPREGLACRLGPPFVQMLDRLLGRMPDPRRPHKVAEHYRAELHLDGVVSGRDALDHPIAQLVSGFADFLAGRFLGTTRFRLGFRHVRTSTCVEIGLAQPSRDVAHLRMLVDERLSRCVLADAVEAVEIESAELCGLLDQHRDLFAREAPAEQAPAVLDRLRARLGCGAVRGIVAMQDHRPEHACGVGEPLVEQIGRGVPPPREDSLDEDSLCEEKHRRPLWILPMPVALDRKISAPWLGGPLDLLSSPERIESGWWDGRDIRRDYFIARDVRGARFWVYRERSGAQGWFLQGVFG